MNVITISKEPIMFNQDDIEIVAAYSPSDDIQKIIEDAEKLQAAYDLFGSKAGASIYNAVQTGKLNLSDFYSFLGPIRI